MSLPPAIELPTPYDGFELQVLVDRSVYAPGEQVRITVTATNHAARFVEHRYPGWQRFALEIRDERHRVVADDRVAQEVHGDGIERWLPGQMTIWPVYWAQTSGPLVPARERQLAGPPPAAGRYRVRCRWLGREPGPRSLPPEVDSAWFTLT